MRMGDPRKALLGLFFVPSVPFVENAPGEGVDAASDDVGVDVIGVGMDGNRVFVIPSIPEVVQQVFCGAQNILCGGWFSALPTHDPMGYELALAVGRQTGGMRQLFADFGGGHSPARVVRKSVSLEQDALLPAVLRFRPGTIGDQRLGVVVVGAERRPGDLAGYDGRHDAPRSSRAISRTSRAIARASVRSSPSMCDLIRPPRRPNSPSVRA